MNQRRKLGKTKIVTTLADALSTLLLLAIVVFCAKAYSVLGAQKAASVLLAQSARRIRLYLFAAFWMAMTCYGLLFLLKRFPRLMYYPVTITPKNMGTQARLAKLMLSVLTLFAMAIALLIHFDLYTSAVDRRLFDPAPLIICLFAGILLDLVIYLILAHKRK